MTQPTTVGEGRTVAPGSSVVPDGELAGLRRIAWTPDKVERVLFLLERIAKELETARLRR